MKRCCTCREYKALAQYTKDKHTKDGLNRRCRGCQHLVNNGSLRRPDTRTREERFWDYVDKSGECWLWTRATSHPKGRPDHSYGVFGHDKTQTPAHRFAYEITYGPIPKGLLVCHTCDNPLCVRPEHLFLGTPAENSADMVRKNRQSQGAAHRTRAKLTPDQVVEIARLCQSSGYTQKQIAKMYGVHARSVTAIATGEAWPDITKIRR